MKAERAEPKQEFIPVIVTLESQEEVDSFFTMGNCLAICNALPAVDGLWNVLRPFNDSVRCDKLYDRLRDILA